MSNDNAEIFYKIKRALKSAYEDGFPSGAVKGKDGVAHLLISTPSSSFPLEISAALSGVNCDEIKSQLYFRRFDLWLEPVAAVLAACVPKYPDQAFFTSDSKADPAVLLVPADAAARKMLTMAVRQER